jgi:hypothetical protein
MTGQIETRNDQFAGVRGDGLVVIAMSRAVMTKTEALRHAAWLVALADDNDEFAQVLAAVRST